MISLIVILGCNTWYYSKNANWRGEMPQGEKVYEGGDNDEDESNPELEAIMNGRIDTSLR